MNIQIELISLSIGTTMYVSNIVGTNIIKYLIIQFKASFKPD